MLKKVLSNTFSQVLSKVGTAFISIFLLSILTKYLSIELFGLYSKVYNYLGIFAFLADLGLYTIAVREITAHKKDSEKIIGNIMTLRGILGGSIILLSLGIAYFLPGYNEYLALLSILVVGFFTLFSLLNSSLLALMQAYMKIEFNLFSTIIGKLANLGAIILIALIIFPKSTLVSFDIPFLWIMGAGLLGIVIHTGLNFFYAKRICRVEFLFDFAYILHILKITLPYGLALFLSVIYFKVDIILLSLLEPKNQADISIALYSLPMKIVEVLMILGGFYLNAILPILSTAFLEEKGKLAKSIIDFSFKILLSVGLLTLVLGVLFREDIIRIIATDEYLHSSHIFNSADALFVVILVAVFYFISALFNYILIASRKESILLKINLFVTLINIIGNIIFIPYFSFIGSGVVTVLSQCALLILGYFSVKRFLDFKIDVPFIFFSLCGAGAIFYAGTILKSLLGLGTLGNILCISCILSMIWGLQFFYFNKKSLKEISQIQAH